MDKDMDTLFEEGNSDQEIIQETPYFTFNNETQQYEVGSVNLNVVGKFIRNV